MAGSGFIAFIALGFNYKDMISIKMHGQALFDSTVTYCRCTL